VSDKRTLASVLRQIHEKLIGTVDVNVVSGGGGGGGGGGGPSVAEITEAVEAAIASESPLSVSAGSLPLPTGAATAAAQAKLLGSLTGNLTAAANATNAAAIATISAPGAGNYTQLTDIYFGYSAAPSAGATLTVSATGITTVVLPVTSAGPGPIRFPLRVPNNVATTITLSAGGSGVVGYVAAIHSTQAV
jgi:hypothetical protein